MTAFPASGALGQHALPTANGVLVFAFIGQIRGQKQVVQQAAAWATPPYQRRTDFDRWTG